MKPLLPCIALALLWAPWLHAATITVNSTAQKPGGSGDCTLGEAIQAAETDTAVDGCSAGSGADTIMIPAGTYILAVVDDDFPGPTGLPRITTTIALQGAGADTTIIERSTSVGTPDFRFLAMLGVGALLTVNDLTFRNGRIADNNGGGAIFVSGASALAINGCVFENNAASSGGRRSGGAISGSELGGGNPITITNSLFSGNTASTGGAIFAVSGVNATDSSFIGNSAFGEGGAIGTDGVQIFRCVFDGNSASGGGLDSRGGAIALSILHPAVPGTIAHSYFADNSTTGRGGAISGAFKTTITGSTFTGNSAGTDGGAIGTGVNRILNSTFVNNTANRGGAVFIGEFLFHFFNNLTIVRNSANVAGGILVDSSTAFMANSVIAENIDLDGGGGTPDAEGSITDLGFNLVGIDPMLGVLQDNGGPKVGANVGGLTPFTLPTISPLAGSPALGTGNPSSPGGFPACEATDQRGFARNVGNCDKGAVEVGAGGGTARTADLSVLGSGTPDPANRCGNITYSVTASNAGPDTATSVTLTDTTGGLVATLTSVTSSQGTCNTASFPSITCNLGELAAGSTAMVTIVVKPNDAGAITNQAGIDSAEDDPNSADNASSVSVTVRQRREPPGNQPGPPCWTSPPG